MELFYSLRKVVNFNCLKSIQLNEVAYHLCPPHPYTLHMSCTVKYLLAVFQSKYSNYGVLFPLNKKNIIFHTLQLSVD